MQKSQQKSQEKTAKKLATKTMEKGVEKIGEKTGEVIGKKIYDKFSTTSAPSEEKGEEITKLLRLKNEGLKVENPKDKFQYVKDVINELLN